MRHKYDKLKAILQEMGSVVVAYSGGVDSVFLSKVAYDVLGDKARAITVIADMVPEREIVDSKKLAKFIGIEQNFISLDAKDVEVFKTNPVDRCYHCKKFIFTTIINKAKTLGIENVADGSNLDDMSDYRPGMKAINELGVRSPLKEAGLTKDDIRALSKTLGLETWDKPSFACLATRFPYGTQVTKALLKQVEQCEDYLLELGFNQFRVRYHGEIARIEVAPDERKKFFHEDTLDRVSDKFKSFGFTFVTLELGGYKMGSMNVGVDK